ncbi:Uncharacterised protein [uncultured archaeon]|nr:Uncharacterised protein [uncultured archaeon]
MGAKVLEDLKQHRNHVLLLILTGICVKFALFFFAWAFPVAPIGQMMGVKPEFLSINLNNSSSDTIPLDAKIRRAFDTAVYIDIAQEGYSEVPGRTKFLMYSSSLSASTCAHMWLFLYPLAIRLLASLVGFVASAILASNFFSLTSTILLYFVALKYVDDSSAFRAAILFLLYPQNLAYGTGGYSEPLFMTFVLSAWLLLEQNILLCGVLIMLASLTRYFGLLLFPLFALINAARKLPDKELKKAAADGILLHLFALPLLYWLFIQVPNDTGISFSQIESMCAHVSFGIPGSSLLFLQPIGAFFLYASIIAVWQLWKNNKILAGYSIVFLLSFMSINGLTAVSIGRYIGIIWPLFIFYGRYFAWKDTLVLSAGFFLLGAIMFIFHVNLIPTTF